MKQRLEKLEVPDSMEGMRVVTETHSMVEAQTMTDIQMLEKNGYESPVLVGTGAFSRVYRAWDVQKKRMVACKVSRKESVWKAETDALKLVGHPLFPTLYASFRERELQVIVLEYVSGVTLGELLKQRGCLHERTARRIAIEIAEGLRYLHENSTPLIYRDLKPDNIIIREDGAVKIIDFGCAGKPGSRTIAGSRGYAAPEQLLGTEPAGVYSDVYGVGKVLQRMLGEDYSGALTDVVASCIRTRAEERIPDMRYLIRELYCLNRENKRKKNLLKEYNCKKNIHIYSV